jgi:putative endonuclease
LSLSNRDRPNRTDHVQIGIEHEQLAEEFYRQEGFQILERNWRAGRKEIDLIARSDNLVVFVEVKSSGSLKYGHPSERVDKRKQRNITEVAQQYMIDKNLAGVDIRFDVVTFTTGQLELFPGAFSCDELGED